MTLQCLCWKRFNIVYEWLIPLKLFCNLIEYVAYSKAGHIFTRWFQNNRHIKWPLFFKCSYFSAREIADNIVTILLYCSIKSQLDILLFFPLARGIQWSTSGFEIAHKIQELIPLQLRVVQSALIHDYPVQNIPIFRFVNYEMWVKQTFIQLLLYFE